MNVRFACPVCEHYAWIDLPGLAEWQCPTCDHLLELHSRAEDGDLHSCALCGNAELYKKRISPIGSA